MVIEFIVPGEPKGKARPRLTRSGHAFTPKETVSYENWVRLCFKEAYPNFEPFNADGPITCHITACFSIPKSTSKKKTEEMLRGHIVPLKKPDADNIAKIICDALNGIAYHDDSQIARLSVTKIYEESPKVEVTLIND